MTKEVALSKGKVAIVDDEDFDRVSEYRWFYRGLHGRSSVEYAIRTFYRDGKHRTVYLHRFILDAPHGVEVDHIDRNGLNNRRSNIRLATRSLNEANKDHPLGKSGFRGVHPMRSKWRGQIMVNQVTYRSTYFSDPVDAARWYDEQARKHFGEFARLNFPDRSAA